MGSIFVRHVILLVYVCIVSILCVQSEDINFSRLVNIAQGPVRGYKDPATGVFIFSGIPYATAPTGRNRYKAPLPPPTWQDPLNAVNKVMCPQIRSPIFSNHTRQEDCLIATVYAPDTNDINLPVVVYIHGSGFQAGFGDVITPKNFVRSKNLIVVTFNHRLGVHGFLCLGTVNAPGNAGMKDQVALLRWVKKNIANFGGDPDNVTLAGYSAGSAFVDLLLLSPTTKGLFNKAIPESGTNIAVISLQSDPIEKAKTHAKALNFYNVDDLQALEDFYLNTPYDLLTSLSYMSEPDSTFGFTPCVERDTGEEMILHDSPLNIITSGDFRKIPILYGFASMEGIMRMTSFDMFKIEMNKDFSKYLPGDLQFENNEQKQETARVVKEFYFGTEPVDDNTMYAYIDYFSDVLFGYPALRSVKLQHAAGNNNIYLYEYSFADVGGTILKYKNYTTTKGADHCGQTRAILDENNLFTFKEDDEENLSEEYKKNKAIMRDIWYNFITTGHPIQEGSSLPAWPPMGANWSPHMSLGNTVELKGSLLLDRALLWEKIYERHYRSPIPPPTPAPFKRSEL